MDPNVLLSSEFARPIRGRWPAVLCAISSLATHVPAFMHANFSVANCHSPSFLLVRVFPMSFCRGSAQRAAGNPEAHRRWARSLRGQWCGSDGAARGVSVGHAQVCCSSHQGWRQGEFTPRQYRVSTRENEGWIDRLRLGRSG